MTALSPRNLRLFVALEMPQAWLDALASVQDEIKAELAGDPELATARVRWVRRESIHLTLKFIGEVAPDRLAPIQQQLALALPVMPDITLSLANIASFEDRRAPGTVWAGIRDEPQHSLLALADSIETWLAAAGVPRERRGFRPHLTLARLPGELPVSQKQRILQAAWNVSVPDVPPFKAEGVSLMQSFLEPGGARYERKGYWPISLYSPKSGDI